MNRENKRKASIKHIHAAIHLYVKTAAGPSYRKARAVIIEIIALIAYTACMWTLSRATEHLIAAGTWNLCLCG